MTPWAFWLWILFIVGDVLAWSMADDSKKGFLTSFIPGSGYIAYLRSKR